MSLKPSERRNILFQVSISPPKTYWFQSSLPVCSFSIPPWSLSAPIPHQPQWKLWMEQEGDLSWPAEGNSAMLALHRDSSLPAIYGDTGGDMIHTLWHSSSKWIASHRCMSGHMYISCLRYYSGEHQYNIRQHAIHSKHGTLWLNMKWQFEIEISLGVFTQKSLDSGVSYSFFKWCCFLIIMVY